MWACAQSFSGSGDANSVGRYSLFQRPNGYFQSNHANSTGRRE